MPLLTTPRARPPRLALVSAHYPPNFVSGGTLVPHRLARGFASRGWDVRVFTGWIGTERAPLSVQDDVDDAGVRIRWVATFHGWGDRRNFDHPAVATAFGSWLDETGPDVVHFHSLQTLGAGLLHTAADRGLATVVTLHDFWWWCARQFLCNRDYHPCCLAVDAGTCRCEVDRPFLEDRNQFTRSALERADRLVAVSDVSSQVALANGVDPRRLCVIENGVPERPDSTAPSSHLPEGPIRFTYAGGPDRMKGVQFLLEAGQLLAKQPGWELMAYGCQEWAAQAEGLPVQFPPAYAPEQLGAVLSATDVLVVPSAMRESYSILTREALGAGVPVICSDSLGPEEVVVHGVNGLIVPSSDPPALANAMAQVIDDEKLLVRLRDGCHGIPIPTVDQQLAAHDRLYQEMIERPTASNETTRVAMGRDIRRVLFVVGIDGAPLRYRAWLPGEGLVSLGVDVDVRYYRHPDISMLGERADAVVMYRVPATVQVLHFIAGVRRLGTPVVFDVDDLIFDPTLAPEIPALKILAPDDAALWLEGVARYRTTMEACDAFIGSTPLLCRHAEEVVRMPAFRFANGVGRHLGKISDETLRGARRPGPLRIGYFSGTNTHDHDWEAIEPAVSDVLDNHPDTELWLVGHLPPTPGLLRFDDRVKRRPVLPWTELPVLLRDLDVNLAPMHLPSRFNEAKSAIKWLEAALVETPTVATPTEPFREVIRHGENGFLAVTHDEWVCHLNALLDDPALRQRLGTRARRDALLEWAPNRQGRRYLEILRSIQPRSVDASPWEPVSKDEPFEAVALEPYPPASAVNGELDRPKTAKVTVARLRAAFGRRSRDLGRAVRDEGVGGATRRTVGFLRRRLGAQIGRR
jgi:glycosyltransferase involved in cell wall biosynthesis